MPPYTEYPSRTLRLLRRGTIVCYKNFEIYLGIFLFLTYASMIIINIILRYFTGSQIPGSHSLIKIMYIWMVWFAAAYMIREDSHIRFTYFLNQYGNRFRFTTYVFEWILWLLLSVIIIRYSIPVILRFINSGAVIPGTDIPRYLPYLILPVGFGFIILRVIEQAIEKTRLFIGGDELEIESSFGGEQ